MNYGYPGANSQFENHNVSEESFWPSFTDIMMVIVMVFLLVTVAVILNNWTLISKLTTSIEAQEAASNLANNRQAQNLTLEKELSGVQKNLLLLNAQYEKEKNALEDTQQKLSSAAEALTLKEQSLGSIESKLSALNEKYETEKERLNSSNQQLSASELKLSNTDKQLIDIKQQLQNKLTIIASLDKELIESKKLNATTQANLDKSQTTLNKTKADLTESETKLVTTQASLDENEASLASTIKSLNEKQKSLLVEQQKIKESTESIEQLQTTISGLEKEKSDLLQVYETEASKLKEKDIALSNLETKFKQNQSIIDGLEKKQTDNIIEITKLINSLDASKEATEALEFDRNVMDKRLEELLLSTKTAKQSLLETGKSAEIEEKKLTEKIALLEKEKIQIITTNEKSQKELKSQLKQKIADVNILKESLAKNRLKAEKIEAKVSESEKSFESFEELLAVAEKQLTEKDEIINKLSSAQEAGNSQLESLQGEYDSLDNKYQKLLQPARSSKGKFVASVTYKQSGGKKVIRYKSSPNGSYRTVTKTQLDKSLAALKKKHKEDLYIKVVIPQNSGLSYNEAWRFTINLQRKYDYYYNK